jgi:hypothetical protein
MLDTYAGRHCFAMVLTIGLTLVALPKLSFAQG